MVLQSILGGPASASDGHPWSCPHEGARQHTSPPGNTDVTRSAEDQRPEMKPQPSMPASNARLSTVVVQNEPNCSEECSKSRACALKCGFDANLPTSPAPPWNPLLSLAAVCSRIPRQPALSGSAGSELQSPCDETFWHRGPRNFAPKPTPHIRLQPHTVHEIIECPAERFTE